MAAWMWVRRLDVPGKCWGWMERNRRRSTGISGPEEVHESVAGQRQLKTA